MAINNPSVDANSYESAAFVDNTDTGATETVQSGWDAANSLLFSKKRNSDYPTDVKLGEEVQLFRFLENEPFAIYKQFWVEKEGKKSYVALGDDDPLATIAGLTARPKFAFNVLNLSAETPEVQVLTAPTTLARQLYAANDDERFGPLTKHFWAISRQGTGSQTVFNLQRVPRSELLEAWKLNPEDIDAAAQSADKYDASIIHKATMDEHLEIARQVVGS